MAEIALIILIVILVCGDKNKKRKRDEEIKRSSHEFRKKFEDSYLENKRKSNLPKEFWDDMDKRYNMVGKE
jgi:Sec-independent protein translocase protein TatA